MIIPSESSREENKMLLPFPLSFPALLIFPSNTGRAATGAEERNLREDARLLVLTKGGRCGGGTKMLSEIDILFSSKTKKAENGLRCVLSKGNTFFRPPWYDCRVLSLQSSGFQLFSSFRPSYWDSSLRALPALSNKKFRLVPGKRWQQLKGKGPCSYCVRLLLSQWGTADNHVSARQRVKWPRADLFGYIIQVESKVTGKARRISNLWGPIYSISRAPKKTPYPSDSIYLLTLFMWAPDIYEGSPTPVTTFLSIAPKISISANISRVSIYGSYGATLQQIFFFCSIASMILGALAERDTPWPM
ncbi:hypothetical protein H5410_032251, partial [Solanum commersonii]